uniref:Uncharacterized protein n=1 Tax=Prasinoderma coloniale TaxID=156133 RepID=A0A7R9TQB4_9VIRI
MTAAGVDVAHATVFRDVQRLREGKPVIVAKPKKQKAPKAVRLPTKKKPQKPQKEKSGVAGGVAPDDALAIAQLITSLSITSKIGDDGKAKARERLHKLSNRELAGILTMMHLDRPATTEGLREAVVSALPMIFAGGE